MKIKRKVIFLTFNIWICSIIFLIICSCIINFWDNIAIAVINALFTAFSLAFVLEIICECMEKNNHSGAEFFLLISTIYNYCSIPKLLVEQPYAELIDNQIARFFGNIFVDVIIITSATLWKRHHERHPLDSKMRFDTIHVSRYIVYIFLLIYLFAEYSCLKIFNMDLFNYSLSLSAMENGFVSVFIYLTYALSFLLFNDQKKYHKYASFIPIIIILVVNLYLTLITGKRNFLMAFIFIMACDFIVMGNIEYSFLKIGSVLSTPFLMLVSLFAFKISDRISVFVNNDKLYGYLFNRYDLSDFAVTISNGFFNINNRLNMIIAAFIETLPTVLFPNIGKTGEKYYIDNLRSAGINVVSSDYSDTVFSMGAQLLGFIGMFLIFLLFIYYFDWLSKKILKQKKLELRCS